MRWILLVLVLGCGLLWLVRRGMAESGAQDLGMAQVLVQQRADMVAAQLEARGIKSAEVLAAMGTVPRHEFVPEAQVGFAYADRPLRIGSGQTISQPYIVALMTELARLEAGERVLEVGTGSGYQAAVLAQMGVEVYSIEIVQALAERAARDLGQAGYTVNLRVGDGYQGWQEAAPFDAILVTAAPDHVPHPLREQLKVGGVLVIPVGDREQNLVVIVRTESGWDQERVVPVMFVPMVGKAEEERDGK
jgi:protein-L-isoaspartate(D-aspartate) O-methyltransferase